MSAKITEKDNCKLKMNWKSVPTNMLKTKTPQQAMPERFHLFNQ